MEMGESVGGADFGGELGACFDTVNWRLMLGIHRPMLSQQLDTWI